MRARHVPGESEKGIARRPIRVVGHRGARAIFPENTIPAFEYAIAAGVDAVEFDTAVTRDKVVVVSHDPTLHPPICSGGRRRAVIHQLTLPEVRQWDCGAVPNPAFPRQQPVPGARMPTLDEVLDLATRGDFDFLIEIKSFPDRSDLAPPPEEFASLVLESVRTHRLEARAIVQSFDFRTLRATRWLAPEIRLAALYSGLPRDFVALARQAGAGIVAPNRLLATTARVRAAHAAGLQVVPWTANTPAQWDRLIAAGVDGIITDDPGALLDFLRDDTAQAAEKG
jgi:glycerophosphoryl diester phosphodiesterase